MSAVAIVSGGMDSVTLAYHLKEEHRQLHLLSFDYGQRHKKELNFATICADRLDADFTLVDLTSVTSLLSGSALTDPNVDVPDGHYAAESMKATVVPNRNAIMLSIAVAAAVAHKATRVATAVHAGDHFIYPDCRPDFIDAMDDAAVIGNEGFAVDDFHISAPFINMTKAQIVMLGHEIGVPFADTWSCYKGGVVHCGTCGTCTERREAFLDAGVTDPTVYLGNTVLTAMTP